MQNHHSRPPVRLRPRRRSQQVAFHPNTGLGVVPNQLPHQAPAQLFLLQDLHLQRRPVGRHGSQEPHPVPPDPLPFGLPLNLGADEGSASTDQQGRQIGRLRRQPGGRRLHLIQPWYLPGPGAAGLRGPGQSGQGRRGRRHKPPARNPAGRPARCLSSIHCRTFLPPGTQIIVVLRRGVVSPTGSTAGFALVLATPWERGRPARTRPGKAMPSSPPRSIRNRSVPDLLCNRQSNSES